MDESRITLNPGDLVMWDDGERSAMLLVTKGGELWFQFSKEPFEVMEFRYTDDQHSSFRGLSAAEVEEVLNGERCWHGDGYLFKCYDAETERSIPDPRGVA